MVDIEGKDIEDAILAQKRWADLGNRLRDLIGSSQEYDKKILKVSIKNQLRYRGNLVRFVINSESEYYRDLLRFSRSHLMLYPYHLSDFIIQELRYTPFQYYISIMCEIIEQDKSYDTLPNFTAADCLITLGIGRNQYIDIMNEARSTHRSFLGMNQRRNARSLLPAKPNSEITIEPWWFINAGNITEDDVRSMVTTGEKFIIDNLISPDGMSNQIQACKFDESNVRSLYLKGLIYMDVLIYDDDLIAIPPLEGFVMNRNPGDYLENLLYKIFVTIDEQTTVKELANILGIDVRLVKNAISIYCRLGFAYKKHITIDLPKSHPSWIEIMNQYEKRHQLVDKTSSIIAPQKFKKIAFFYDSDVAAVLMMGNLSAKLKNHAVTMFEVGKLSDEWIDSLQHELSQIESENMVDGGYEAKRYFVHALMLGRTLAYLRNNKVTCDDNNPINKRNNNKLDLIRIESLSILDHESCQKFLVKNYDLIISVAPLIKNDIMRSSVANIPYIGPGSPSINSIWFRLYLYQLTGFGTPSLLLVQGYRLRQLPEALTKYGTLLIHYWNRDPTCVGLHNALATINEALTQSPLLVQAYPIPPICGNLTNGEEKCFVPIPFIQDGADGGQLNIDKLKLSEADADNDVVSFACYEKCPAVQKLKQLDQFSQLFGYITLLKTGKWIENLLEDDNVTVMSSARRRTSSSLVATNESQSADELLLYDCTFGIPLFDDKLNEQVRSRLSRTNNLSDPSLVSEYVETTNKLIEDVNKFVDSYVTIPEPRDSELEGPGDQKHFFKFPNSEQFRSVIPRPTQNLIFNQGILTIYCDHDDNTKSNDDGDVEDDQDKNKINDINAANDSSNGNKVAVNYES